MHGTDLYVGEFLSKIERERREAPHSNDRWLIEFEMTRPQRRSFATWLGDRLVTLGERLRGWSAGEAQPIRTRRAL